MNIPLGDFLASCAAHVPESPPVTPLTKEKMQACVETFQTEWGAHGKILDVTAFQNVLRVSVEEQPARILVLGKGCPPLPTRRRNQARRNRLMRQWGKRR